MTPEATINLNRQGAGEKRAKIINGMRKTKSNPIPAMS